MSRARLAYFNEFRVSSNESPEGETHVIMRVRLFPPSESLRRRVIFEARYGTCPDFLLESLRALITFPRASRPLLMWTDSLKRSPMLPVRWARSEPAKSTKWNFADVTCNGGCNN